MYKYTHYQYVANILGRNTNHKQVKIDYTNLTHIHIMKYEEQPLCSQCNEPLSIKHVVLDCPLYVNVRNILNQPSSMKEALGEHNTQMILNFFKSIGIDTQI